MCYTTGEMAANRFRWLGWFIPIHLLYAATLLVLTGHGYLHGILPESVMTAIVSLDACRLRVLLGVMGLFALIKLMGACVQLWFRKRTVARIVIVDD